VTSADGRWAYTLYNGAGMAPFVHALDTVGAEAHCIDLDALAGRNDLFDLRLRRGGGGTLVVSTAREPLTVIDLATLQVRKPDTAPAAHEGQGLPWLPIAGGIGVLAAAAGGLVLLRRRRLAPT
jgi:LPXTG-motif cell wall-anchored protein